MVEKYWAALHGRDRRVRRRIDGRRDRVAGQPELRRGRTAPVDEVVPSEGVTGWADTWMISANAPHPNCMLKWMDYTLRPDVQAQVAYWYGAAGSNTKSCDALRDLLGKKYADLVDTVRYGDCGNADFLNAIYLWKTPEANCDDDRGRRVHGLLRVAAEVDGDPGSVGTPATAGAFDRPRRSPSAMEEGLVGPVTPSVTRRCRVHARFRGSSSGIRAGGSASSWARPLAWFLIVYLGVAGRAVRLGVLAARRLHRRDRPAVGAPELPDALARPTSTARSRSERSGWRPPSRSPTSILAFPLAYYAARLATPRRRHIDPGRGRRSRCGPTTWCGSSRGS